MIYTIYNTTSGKILRVVGTTNIEIQLEKDESYLEGSYDDTKYYIEEGNLVEIPAKPNDYHYFNYDTKQWVENTNKLISDIMIKRRNLLTASDWTQLPNGPLTEQRKLEWQTYRQQLRDITSQAGYPTNVVWPTPPGSTQTS
jgi:hypothetical protein